MTSSNPDVRTSAPSSSSDLAALRARFKVTLPIWPVGPDGRCTCPVPNCRRPGKHADKSAPETGPYAVVTGAEERGGSGLIVLDADVKGGIDGIAELAKFLGVKGEELPKTLTVDTPSNGLHVYLQHPGAVRINGKLNGQRSAVDVKGDPVDENGLVYVVGPGSPGYVKTDDPCVVRPAQPYKLNVDAEPMPMPMPVQLALVQRKKKCAPGGVPVTPIDDTHPDFARRATLGEKYCREHPAAIDGQGGSNVFFALAKRLMVELALPVDAARALVLKHWNDRCAPPWSPEEIDHKLEDAAKEDDPTRRILPEGLAKKIASHAPTTNIETDAIAALAERVQNGPEPYIPPSNTDTGNAELFVQLHGGNVRFVPKWQTWLVWDGQRWKPDDLDTVATLAKDVARTRWTFVNEYGTDAKDKLDLSKWAHASESKRGRENTLALAKCEEGIPISHDSLDADPWLLNVKNGTVDLRTGKLRSHDRAKLITKLAPVDFDPDATCPTWDAFLSRVTGGDADLASFLARAVGYSLTGSVQEQALFFLQGLGANGKSTFTLIVRELLGDYAKQGAPDLLLAKHGEAHPTEQADLHGARFVLCQEVDQGRAWAEATLKQLTGGDRVKARRMAEDFWEFAPTHKLWVCANHKPKVRGTDEGIWRRIKLVPFAVTIPAEERDPNLLERLRAELPGILAWAVRGCLEWQRSGLGVAAKIARATAEYRAEEDRVGAFLDEACRRDEKCSVAQPDLFSAYLQWVRSSNEEESLTKKEFGDRVASKGFVRSKSGSSRTWKGLRLATAADRVFDAPSPN